LLLFTQLNKAAVRKVVKKYDKLRLRGGGAYGDLMDGNEYLQNELRSSYKFLGQTGTHLAELKALALFERDVGKVQDDATNYLQQSVPEISTDDFKLECAVCLCPLFKPVGLSCNHVFCSECTDDLFSQNGQEEEVGRGDLATVVQCPICRTESVRADISKLPAHDKLTRALFPNSFKTRQNEKDQETEKMVKEAFAKYGGGKGGECVVS